MARKRRYYWYTWLQQPTTTLVRGVDYDCSQSAITQQARSEASARGVRVSIKDHGNSITIEVPSALPHTLTPAIAAQHPDVVAGDGVA